MPDEVNLPAVPLPNAAVSKLAAALAQAASKTGRVAHDKTNDYHKYGYTSAEAVIAEAHDALSAAGISLVPIESTLDGYEREGCNRFSLHRKWLLIYPDGERLPISINWPVCPDKGRPLDKAFASALTTSLAYVLRDLLLMPRVSEEDDQAARDDRPQETPAQRPPPKKTTPAPAPSHLTEGADRWDALCDLATSNNLEWRGSDLWEAMRGADQHQHQITQAQADQIAERLSVLREYKDAPPANGRLMSVYFEESEARLIHEGINQAGDLEKKLAQVCKDAKRIWAPDWPKMTAEQIRWVWQTVNTFVAQRLDAAREKAKARVNGTTKTTV